MNRIVKTALIASALAGAPLLASAPAMAATDFSISLGNAAFGYSDGYWDRDHQWHAWRNRAEAAYFRDHYRDHYYAVRHDRDRKDRDKGWRNERWWEEEHR
jgi:Spy/CpxP family protein refolding chaperone